ncbi:MAG: hypothetical protein JSR36_19505 [Proteobacteria bacterium]|nr:hypothetical protein [Pseudomonadota bacterium]
MPLRIGALADLLRKKDGTPQVVHQRTRRWRVAVLAATLLIGLFALYVVYEFGRYNAGYDRQAVAQRRTELEVKIEHLEKENREMRTKLAELDTFRVGRANEQAEVARAMGELQAQVAREAQELAFYRGVVAQGAASIGLKIEKLRISQGTRPGGFILHLSLLRSGRADGEISGTVQFSLDGTLAGAARSLDLDAVSPQKAHEVRYSFRYYQNIDQEVVLPPGFKPEQVSVEVSSGKKDIAPLSQTFLWTVESAP